jgi:hypothetical protein
MVKVYSTVSRQRIRLPQMGPQDPKDVGRDTARDLSALVGELAALKGDAAHWLTDPGTLPSDTGSKLRTRRLKRRWWRLGVGCG